MSSLLDCRRITSIAMAALVAGCSRATSDTPTSPTSERTAVGAQAAPGSVGYYQLNARFYRALGVRPSNATVVDPGAAPGGTIRRVTTIFNTDYTSAGVGGLRDIGSGTIMLSGVSGSVTRALLYWHGPTNSDPTTAAGAAANATVAVNGNTIVGRNIGASSDNCWGYANSQAYVADVTGLVQSTGNGSYALTRFGNGTTPSGVNTNGASLIVFFNDGNPNNNRDVVLYEGNDSNIDNPYDAPGWNVTLDGITYRSGTANMQLHVSDGQVFDDDAVVVNGRTLLTSGPVFQGDTTGNPGQRVRSANNGPGNNGSLWDIRDVPVTSLLSPGTNTLSLTTGVNADCLSLVSVLVDLPSGSAPTPPISFVPGTISLSLTGTVTVYLYSSATFDATQANAADVRLLVDNRTPGAAVAKRGAAYLTLVKDQDGDGRLDRAFVFTMADLRAAGLTTTTNAYTLQGNATAFPFSGRPVTLPTVVP